MREKRAIHANARELRYEEVRFQGKPALFTSLRVSAGSIPEGIHRYEIRHDDDSGDPCQLARGILVNHFGTLLAAEAIPLPEGGYLDFAADDLNFIPYGCDTLESFQQRYCNGAAAACGAGTVLVSRRTQINIDGEEVAFMQEVSL